MESHWEYGPRRGFWRLIETLARYDLPATFFCCGRALEKNPEAAREIAERHHEVAAQGYRYVPYHDFSVAQERSEIAKAVTSIERMTGQRPVGWQSRAPSLNTRKLVVEHGGFVYDSDSLNDDLPYFTNVAGNRFLTVPYAVDATDDRYWSIRGMPGFTEPDDLYEVLRVTFDRLYHEGAEAPRLMTVGLHLRIAGRPSRAIVVDRFLAYATQVPNVWFARRVEIANWWREHEMDHG